jgi:mRNA interferase RelE/StbE
VVEVRYRESFLRDLKKLKKLPIYEKIYTLSFETLPAAAELREIQGVKAMLGHRHRYRIRVASYRIGIAGS